MDKSVWDNLVVRSPGCFCLLFCLLVFCNVSFQSIWGKLLSTFRARNLKMWIFIWKSIWLLKSLLLCQKESRKCLTASGNRQIQNNCTFFFGDTSFGGGMAKLGFSARSFACDEKRENWTIDLYFDDLFTLSASFSCFCWCLLIVLVGIWRPHSEHSTCQTLLH